MTRVPLLICIAHLAASTTALNSFTDLIPSLQPALTKALTARGISSPTPIQRAALPRVFAGESVVLHAETGSGKSLAFILPTLARLGADEKMLMVTPTRELAVQLANEAAPMLPSPSEVQLVVIGATPLPEAMLKCKIVCCTAPEMLSLMDAAGEATGVLDEVLSQVRVLVLDELDSLLPIDAVYGPRAAERKRAANKQAGDPPAQTLLLRIFELCAARDLQLLAASATVSRPSRLKLARVLRRDPLGRWFTESPQVVRPEELAQADLSTVPRAVTIPSGVRHLYVRLPVRIPHRRSGTAASRLAVAGRRRGRVTLKQKRQLRAMREAAASAEEAAKLAHPLLVALEQALEELRPSSALVFLCRSSGLTVRKAAKQLHALGVSAVPLHEAIGLEHATKFTEAGDTDDGAASEPRSLRQAAAPAAGEEEEDDDLADLSVMLQKRHTAVSEVFRRAGLSGSVRALNEQGPQAEGQGDECARAGSSNDSPLVITFEDMARGLHFEGVEVVFILGLPDSPATYLHLAGRTGRQPVLNGTVVTVCPGNAFTQLCSWSERLGRVEFEELRLSGLQESLDAARPPATSS